MQQLSCVRAQVHAATSVAFSQDGSLIFGGFDKKLAVFDLSRPGHGCREVVTKRRREEGLPGAVQLGSLCQATQAYTAAAWPARHALRLAMLSITHQQADAHANLASP